MSRFAKNNIVRLIVGFKRADTRRIDEMRVEIGVKEHVKKLMRMWLVMWKELAKRVNAQNVEGKWRRGRPKM